MSLYLNSEISTQHNVSSVWFFNITFFQYFSWKILTLYSNSKISSQQISVQKIVFFKHLKTFSISNLLNSFKSSSLKKLIYLYIDLLESLQKPHRDIFKKIREIRFFSVFDIYLALFNHLEKNKYEFFDRNSIHTSCASTVWWVGILSPVFFEESFWGFTKWVVSGFRLVAGWIWHPTLCKLSL